MWNLCNVLFLELIFEAYNHNSVLPLFFYLFQNGLINLWAPKDWHFIKTIKAILHKILKLGGMGGLVGPRPQTF